ncbi:hypothetical protein QP810_09995 [Streptococcus agalactiae]|uniref:hypothetical protein n=1 Tax=Streptococcus agalactiae TaxID=1311 RepID=UPI0025539A8B|nr:hypothetical protein [Streptococcus agalactiae]MDK8747555.1 hypothetical protein [Streptococcus agalactiae]
MFERNLDIKNAIEAAKRNHGIKTWQIIEMLSIHETTFYRMMRKELPEGKKKEIYEVIKDLQGKM